MRRRVIQYLRTLNAVPVENPAQPGTPDVNYVEGWIELKKLDAWPKSKDAVVTISHFTPQQRNWLTLRRRRGGRAFLLLQVKDEWLLFDGLVAAESVGRVPRAQLEYLAARHWRKGLRAEELKEMLQA